MKTLNEIADIVHASAKRKGFHPRKIKRRADDIFLSEQLMNTICEIAELWEAHRNGVIDRPCDKAGAMAELGLPILTCREEEYADIVIRVLDQCRRLRVDIARAIEVKHQYNQSRPWRHGGKKN